LASLAPPGTPATDILVVNIDESIVATIQVKTRTSGRDGGWHMSKKHESIIGDKLFYVFVDFELEVPNVFIIPSKVVAAAVSESHKAWLATPGKNGRAHKDGKWRRLEPSWKVPVTGFGSGWMDKYHERWDLLVPSPES
jgi:hypothetical protein